MLWQSSYCYDETYDVAWNGDTVNIMNSSVNTIEILLAMLVASLRGRSCRLFPHVDTLTLTRGDFIMNFTVK